MFPITLPNSNVDTFVVPAAAAYAGDADYATFVTSGTIGELAVFLEDGTTQSVLSEIAEGAKFFIAQKQADDFVKKSPLYTKASANYQDLPYEAPVAEVQTATVTSTASVKGETHSLLVVNESRLSEPYERIRFDFVTVTGAEAATDIAAGIQAEYDQYVALKTATGRGADLNFTLSTAGAVITLTAKDANNKFTLSFAGDATGTIATTTAWVKGNGYAAQVDLIERAGDVFDMQRINKVHDFDNWGLKNQFINPQGTYDLISLLDVKTERKTDTSFSNHTYTYGGLIAVEQGGTLAAELRVILGL